MPWVEYTAALDLHSAEGNRRPARRGQALSNGCVILGAACEVPGPSPEERLDGGDLGCCRPVGRAGLDRIELATRFVF